MNMPGQDPAAEAPEETAAPEEGAGDAVLAALDQAAQAIEAAKMAYSGEEKAEPMEEEAPAPKVPAAGGMAKQGKGNMLAALGL